MWQTVLCGKCCFSPSPETVLPCLNIPKIWGMRCSRQFLRGGSSGFILKGLHLYYFCQKIWITSIFSRVMCFRLYFIYKTPWSNSFRYSNHIQVTFEHFFEGFMYYLIALTSMIPYKHFLFFFKDMAFLWIPPLAENTLYWKWSGCTVYSQVSVAFCHEHREWALGLAFRVSETRIRCSDKGHALCQGARGHAWDFLSGLCSLLWDKQHRTSGCKWFLRNDFWGGESEAFEQSLGKHLRQNRKKGEV